MGRFLRQGRESLNSGSWKEAHAQDTLFFFFFLSKGDTENQREKDLPKAIQGVSGLVGFEPWPSGPKAHFVYQSAWARLVALKCSDPGVATPLTEVARTSSFTSNFKKCNSTTCCEGGEKRKEVVKAPVTYLLFPTAHARGPRSSAVSPAGTP